MFECGMHAREWLAPAACMWIIKELIDPVNREYLSNYTFTIIPMMNPDGYLYTWYYEREWRKNRSPSPIAGKDWCRGADLNRNFDVHFGTESRLRNRVA